jgi:hypothetical protein
MTDHPERHFDPRFDPEFQRGFDPEEQKTSAPAHPRPRISVISSVFIPPRLISTRIAGPDITPTSESAAPDAAETAGRREAPAVAAEHAGAVENRRSAGDVWAAEEDGAEEDGAEEDQPDADSTATLTPTDEMHNPFLLVLAALGLLFVGTGIWMFTQAYAAFQNVGSFTSQGDFMALQTSMQAAPLLVVLGAGTAVGVLFVLAAHWHRRPGGRRD